MRLKISSANWRPFCPGWDELKQYNDIITGKSFRITDPLRRKSTTHWPHTEPVVQNLVVSLLLAWASCWTNSRVICDLRSQSILNTKMVLYESAWFHWKQTAMTTLWYNLVWEIHDISFVLSWPVIILCMRPANEIRHYSVMSPLIGWAHIKMIPAWLKSD